MKILAIIIGLLTWVAIGCKKESESEKRKSSLTAPDCWGIAKVEFLDTTTQTWVKFDLDTCMSDNCWSFNPDGSGGWYSGVLKCGPGEPNSVYGTWSIDDSDDSFTMAFHIFGSRTYTISELTDQQLIIDYPVTGFGPYATGRETYTPE